MTVFGAGFSSTTTPMATHDTLGGRVRPEKLLAQLSPYRFRTLMAFNLHNDDFNWFDLEGIG
jgi:hypothetical protein